jgi:Protein of unknown function (DUF1186)
MMTIEEILAKLNTYDYSTFQREALQAAIMQQEAITPALLSIIERIANNPQFLDENPDYMGFTYVALYLLAQFREKRAYSVSTLNSRRKPTSNLHGLRFLSN